MGPGRPTLCTDDTIAEFEKCILDGGTMADAADLIGVARSTAADWMARGLRGEAPFSGFSDAVTRARAKAKMSAIRSVRDGALLNGTHDWRASATYLERQYPAEWGPQQAVSVKVEKELEKALDKLKEDLPADAYELVLASLSREAGGEAPPGDQG